MQTRLDPKRPSANPAPAVAAGRWRTAPLKLDTTLAMFREHGGVARADEVVDCLRPHCRRPISMLARWIASRDVMSIDAHGEHWLPLFQFDLGVGTLRPQAHQVFTTLTPAFDAGEIVSWFVEPNVWLHGAAPVSMWWLDAGSVLQAARTDPYVALG